MVFFMEFKCWIYFMEFIVIKILSLYVDLVKLVLVLVKVSRGNCIGSVIGC